MIFIGELKRFPIENVEVEGDEHMKRLLELMNTQYRLESQRRGELDDGEEQSSHSDE